MVPATTPNSQVDNLISLVMTYYKFCAFIIEGFSFRMISFYYPVIEGCKSTCSRLAVHYNEQLRIAQCYYMLNHVTPKGPSALTTPPLTTHRSPTFIAAISPALIAGVIDYGEQLLSLVGVEWRGSI